MRSTIRSTVVRAAIGAVLTLLAAPSAGAQEKPIVTATPQSATSVAVSWTAPPGATAYKLQRRQGTAGPFDDVTDKISAMSHTDGALLPATTYAYRVRGFWPDGTSASSDAALVTTPAAPAPPEDDRAAPGGRRASSGGVGIAVAAPALDALVPAPRSIASQLDPSLAAYAIPGSQIDKLFLLGSCSPGGTVAVNGSHLGSQPGEIRLIGQFPGGSVKLSVLEWEGGTYVGARVPSDVSGVPDHQVHVQVTRQDGSKSGTLPCQFRAARETRRAWGDFTQVLCHVGVDYFAGSILEPPDSHQTLYFDSSHSISCYHRCSQGNNGTDVFKLVGLKNGWTYTGWGLQQNGENEDNHVNDRRGFVPGPGPLALEVDWECDDGICHYTTWIEMEGPRGVPHK